jgi:hypothetical protein
MDSEDIEVKIVELSAIRTVGGQRIANFDVEADSEKSRGWLDSQYISRGKKSSFFEIKDSTPKSGFSTNLEQNGGFHTKLNAAYPSAHKTTSTFASDENHN